MHFVVFPISIISTSIYIIKNSFSISFILFHLTFVSSSRLISNCIYFSWLFLRFYWICFLASFVDCWKKMYLWLISKSYRSFLWSYTIWPLICNYIIHPFCYCWRIKIFIIGILLTLSWLRSLIKFNVFKIHFIWRGIYILLRTTLNNFFKGTIFVWLMSGFYIFQTDFWNYTFICIALITNLIVLILFYIRIGFHIIIIICLP